MNRLRYSAVWLNGLTADSAFESTLRDKKACGSTGHTNRRVCYNNLTYFHPLRSYCFGLPLFDSSPAVAQLLLVYYKPVSQWQEY